MVCFRPFSRSPALRRGTAEPLDRPPWRDLRDVLDMTVTEEEVLAKVEKNDLPNARLVISQSAAGELVFRAD